MIHNMMIILTAVTLIGSFGASSALAKGGTEIHSYASQSVSPVQGYPRQGYRNGFSQQPLWQ
jgi:hypothetical protein